MSRSLRESSLLNTTDYRSLSVGSVPTNEYLIQTIEVGATPEASVTFSLSGLEEIYRHLQLIYTARTNRSVVYMDPIAMQVNSDTTSGNYKYHYLTGDSITVSCYNGSLSAGGLRVGNASSANSTANSFAVNVVDILDPFETTKNLTTKVLSSAMIYGTGTDNEASFTSSLWLSSALVTTLTLTPNSGSSFTEGSRFSLYGVTA